MKKTLMIFGLGVALEGGCPQLAAGAGTNAVSDKQIQGAPCVLKVEDYAHHVTYFNRMEPELRKNLVPNEAAWGWMKENVPLFECSASEVEEIYYFRWWSLRKHLRKDEAGRRVFTEFLTKQRTISSALGHHIAELRWLHDQTPVNEYVTHWLRGGANGAPQAHLHKYSGWLPWALWQRELVTGDAGFNQGVLNDLVADYGAWEKERLGENGLFWQYDVWDAMEESISGSRTKKNARPTINSYMYGSAVALSQLAKTAGRSDVVELYARKAAELRKLTQEKLWDSQAEFFKVRLDDGDVLADVREETGFVPWYFNLPQSGQGFEKAWAQLKDPQGFKAPYGITTAERRHPKFRTHGTGTCEWDGAVWPYATSQTLTALANVLNGYEQTVVGKADYFDAFLTYTRSQRYYGLPYIGEYHDEQTGHWLKDRQERSFYYNHSTYADLVITGIAGLRPRADEVVEVNPLVPEATWGWFCVDGIAYHGHTLTILWDADGSRYGRGKGLVLLVDGVEKARSEKLGKIEGRL